MKNIIDLLVLRNYYGVSKEVDIAKGLYKIPYSTKECLELFKRIWKIKR